MSHPVRSVLAVVATLASLLLPVSVQAAASPAGDLKIAVEKNRMKAFSESTTIIVPTVYLKLPVSGKISVHKQGSALSTLGGGNANTVKASASYTVKGLDKRFAQALAARVYDDVVAQLRAAGYTVKTYEDIQDVDTIKNAEREAADGALGLPEEKDRAGTALYVIAAPSDAQVFKSGLSGGVFNQFMKLGKSTAGEGTIVIPTFVIAAPQAYGQTGSGYKSISASVNVAPGMTLMSAMAQLLTQKGGWGDVRTKSWTVVADQVGSVSHTDTTSNAGNAFSSAMSTLTGAGKITGKSGSYVMTIDRAAYEAAVLRAAAAFDAEVAQAAGAAKK